MAWLNDVPPPELRTPIARPARAGVGIDRVALSYAEPPQRAGLHFGCAALRGTAIRAGLRWLADVL